MSKIINSFLSTASNLIKKKLTKSEFNPKLIDLKIIKLVENKELQRSKLNPLAKGLLLDETKGKFENVNLNSDSIETIRKEKALIQETNLQINNTSWFDYLKKAMFSNKILDFNYFSKYLNKNNISNKNQNNNFSFNCDGTLIGFINQNRELIISNTELNNKLNLYSNEEITSFTWDSICPNKLYYSSNGILYECLMNLRECKTLINKKYLLSNISKFINCFPSPKGDLLILLYEKKIEVYDIFQNLLFSKIFLTFKFKNGLYDYKSSVFISYTENKLIIFNLDTFDFKPYSYFPGNIIKVINSSDNDNIYVFVINNSKDSNELFMYTLTDISIASDINLNFNSYQNNDDYYRQYHYVFRPEIYSFQHNLMNLHTKILDVNLSPNDFRVGILFEEELYNQPIQNSLYIFALTKDTRDNTINRGFPLYNFGHIDGSQIVSFQFIKMLNQGYTFLMVRFENDNFIRTEKING